MRAVRRRNRHRLAAGDLGPLVASAARDVRFVSPGRTSWSGEFRGLDAVERWVRRFVRVGLRLDPDPIRVAAPPWDTTVGLGFTDHLPAPAGEVVYANRGVIVATIAWGKPRRDEVHEETPTVAAIDDQPAVARAGRPLPATQEPTDGESLARLARR